MKTKWRVLDSWAYVKGDAETELPDITKRQMLEQWAHVPGVKVQAFKRHVRAGGAFIPVLAIVCRAPIPQGG